MKNPKTVEEYIDLVHQAVYFVDELRVFSEENDAQTAEILPWIDALDKELRQLYDDMTSGRYHFDPNGPDLPFMAAVRKFGAAIPFRQLLSTINHTHRFGLDAAP